MDIICKGEIMGYIYCITNKVNNKKYIGKTNDAVEQRFKEHCAAIENERDYNRPLYRAFRKYGLENFSVKQIDEADSEELLSKKEIYWIDKLNTYKNGYNATKGGDGNLVYNHEAIWKYYQKEGKNNIQQTADYFGCDRRVVRSIINEKGVYNKPMQIRTILQLNKDTLEIIESFESACAAAKTLYSFRGGTKHQANRNPILLACKDISLSAYGYCWCFEKDYNQTKMLKERLEANKTKEAEKKKKRSLRDIKKFGYDGKLIKEEFLKLKSLELVLKKYPNLKRENLLPMLKRQNVNPKQFDPKIYKCSLDGKKIGKGYFTATEASIDLCGNKRQANNINACLRGEQESSNGYKWIRE